MQRKAEGRLQVYPPSKALRSPKLQDRHFGFLQRIIMYKRTPTHKRFMRYKRFLKHKGFFKVQMIKGAVLQLPFLSSNHYLGVKENRNLANRRRRRQKAESDGLDNAYDNHGMRGYCFAIVMAQKEKGTLCKTGKGQ